MSTIKPDSGQLNPPEDLGQLREEFSKLRAHHTRVMMEKNFLERATQHLNFHNNAHDGVVYTDEQDHIIYANPYFLEMLEIGEKEELLNQPFPASMWNHPEEADQFFRDVKVDGFVREREMVLNNREGQPIFTMCSGVASRDNAGEVIGTEIMFCNITSKRKIEAELIEQQALLDAILDSTPDPTLILSANLRIKRSTPAAKQLFGLQDERSDQDIFALMARVGVDEGQVSSAQAGFERGQSFNLELELNSKYMELRAAPLQSKEEGWVCVLHDITERKRTEQNLEYHAHHDMLTRLPNRSYFEEKLDRIIHRYQRDHTSSFALLFLDLDKLKMVNDSYGHHVGDQFLIEFSRRLENCVRPGDMVGRLGGDEFAVYLNDVPDEEAAMKITQRIHKAMQEPFTLLRQHRIEGGASIGICLFDHDTTTAQDMLRRADEAMYRAKKEGGNTYRI